MSRPLLPAPRRSDDDTPAPVPSIAFPKLLTKGRSHVSIACNSCRKSKSKCDGARPTCTKCSKSNKPCTYVAQADALPPQVLKRNLRQLEEQNQDLKDLIGYLRRPPGPQVDEVLRRLRNGEDAQALATLLRDSDVLLQLAHPSPPKQPRINSSSIRRSATGSMPSEHARRVSTFTNDPMA